MRIAVYHNLLSGGAKRTLEEVVRRLATRHRIDVYTLSSSERAFADVTRWATSHQVEPFRPHRLLQSPFGRLNQALRWDDLRRLNRVGRQVAARIDEQGYDVAFVHPCQYEQAPSLLSHLQRTPSVYYCQEPLRLLYEVMPGRPYDKGSAGWRRALNAVDPLPRLYRSALRTADQANTRRAGAVLVNSRYMARAVETIYGVGARVSYLGVDTDHFRPADVPKRHVVLSVGSLTPLKGFDFLVRAMAHYPAGNRPVLVIASNFQNPPERAYLERLARELGVDLTLSGNVNESELVRLYREARALVYAPVGEPFGLVPLEAMACGVPVVAVAEGGVPESVVDGQTGILTDRDPARFAAAVQRVVDDHDLARRLGETARGHVVNHWTWDRAVATLEEVLLASTHTRSYVRPSIPALAH
jgi:glycosyltransferase involved in cell wall biosynthesis